MHGFRITTTPIESEAVLVALSGEADLSAAPEFSRELTSAVELGSRLIVVDLGHATFIDSTALRVLLQGRTQLEARGGSMYIVCPDRSLWKIFEITGLAELFPRFSTVEEAVAAVPAKASVVTRLGGESAEAGEVSVIPIVPAA
jgi:anti-sigma B factor antagonist